MIHDDIEMDAGWLTILLNEYEQSGADVLSAVIPLKDERGLTSTGIMDWVTKGMKKLSLREALALPKTFNATVAGYPNHCLLINTGLWVCDISRPWAEKIVFRNHDTIVKDENGDFQPRAVSEDWLFSIDAARLGLKVMATTAIKAKHLGSFSYPNFVAWGSNEDEGRWAEAWNIDPPSKWSENDYKGHATFREGLAREATGRSGSILAGSGECCFGR